MPRLWRSIKKKKVRTNFVIWGFGLLIGCDDREKNKILPVKYYYCDCFTVVRQFSSLILQVGFSTDLACGCVLLSYVSLGFVSVKSQKA